jgi:hypothetical protein
MDEYLRQALREYNMEIPPSSPWYASLEQLPASIQSRIELRAAELAESNGSTRLT